MKINFKEMDEQRISEFKGGVGEFIPKMFVNELGKIIHGKLEPGSTIGYHKHEEDSEIIYILEGNGKCLYDDGEETLTAGDCTYCPKGHSHSLINNSDADLIFFAVVAVQ